jgi:hypothetical protein
LHPLRGDRARQPRKQRHASPDLPRLRTALSGQPRCEWVPHGDPVYIAYHDEEWGAPSHDEQHLFEMLVLEAAQAGLSWSTILRKRDGYRSRIRRTRGRLRRRRSTTCRSQISSATM